MDVGQIVFMEARIGGKPECDVVCSPHQLHWAALAHEDPRETMGSHFWEQILIAPPANADARKRGRQGVESEINDAHASRSLDGQDKGEAWWRRCAWLLQRRAWRSGQS